MTNLLEKILNAFESSARTSNRIDSDEDDDGLSKKIGDLTDMVKNLRSDLSEIKTEQVKLFKISILI